VNVQETIIHSIHPQVNVFQTTQNAMKDFMRLMEHVEHANGPVLHVVTQTHVTNVIGLSSQILPQHSHHSSTI
jgi:hypothetical protein